MDDKMTPIGDVLEATGNSPTTMKQKTSSWRDKSENVREHEIELAQESMERLGYAADPFCLICGGYGSVHPRKKDGSPDYGAVIACPANGCMDDSFHKQEAGEAAMLAKGLTSYRHTFAGFKQLPGTENSFAAFQALAEGETDKPVLLCIGGVGCGKSHLCEALALRLNQRGVNTYYYSLAVLLGHLKASIPSNGVETWVTSLSTLPGLVLDDWGVELGSEFELSLLGRIIDERYRWHRITAVTSNRSLEQLRLTDPRIASRFMDGAVSVVVINSAGDYRSARR